MKILTWNVGHQTYTNNKNLPGMADALASLSPDVIVLTEYVRGLKHNQFVSDLKSYGLGYWLTSPITPKQNQVFIASRTPLEVGNIPVPHIEEVFTSNVLHVKIPDKNIEVLGWRMPAFESKDKDRKNKRNVIWDWITTRAREKAETRFIIIGDFNTDPMDNGTCGGRRLSQLAIEGWTHALPISGASWWSPAKPDHGRQLDHAIFSRHFVVEGCEYITESGPYVFARKSGAMSDHAVLLVDFDDNPIDSKTDKPNGDDTTWNWKITSRYH